VIQGGGSFGPSHRIFGASRSNSVDNSRVSASIRFSRCSRVIGPPFDRRAPGDRRQHFSGDASPADFDMNFVRRIVSFDD
jgi:hypothetical protein